MDGWWNEEETFYPFVESPDDEDDLYDEEDLSAAEDASNPFTPISVTDRLEKMEHQPSPTAKPFAPPKPGQPYGQGFSKKAPLSPPKSFGQIQQGDLYGYSAPDSEPATVTTTNPYVVPNAFGTSAGAPPLGAVTPDTPFPQHTGTTQRQTTRTGPVPIWSIDDDQVALQSATAGSATSPYPGFPPLPQTKPAPWQQPVQPVSVPVTAQEPLKQELDWTLPAYPEADPNWQPPEGEAPEIPDFLQEEAMKAKEEAKANAEKSSKDKLNIPAYLRMQPLSKKKAHSEEGTDAPKDESVPGQVDTADPEPSQETAAASQPEEENWYSNAVYMRPKTETSETTQEPAPAATSGRRSRRSRVAEQEAEQTPADTPPAQEPEQPRKRRRRSEAVPEEPQPEPTEESRPFVPPVGAEDPAAETSATRPAQDVSSPANRSTSLKGAIQLQPFVRRTPEPASLVPAADIDGDDDWRPHARPSGTAIADSASQEWPGFRPNESESQRIAPVEVAAAVPAAGPSNQAVVQAPPAPAEQEWPGFRPNESESQRIAPVEVAAAVPAAGASTQAMVQAPPAPAEQEWPGFRPNESESQRIAPVEVSTTHSSRVEPSAVSTNMPLFAVASAPFDHQLPPIPEADGDQWYPLEGDDSDDAETIEQPDDENLPVEADVNQSSIVDSASETPLSSTDDTSTTPPLPPIPEADGDQWYPLECDDADESAEADNADEAHGIPLDEATPESSCASVAVADSSSMSPFTAADSPFGNNLPPLPEDDGDRWSLFAPQEAAVSDEHHRDNLPTASTDHPAPAVAERPAPLFDAADSPFDNQLPPIPDAVPDAWSPLDTLHAQDQGAGAPYGESFPPMVDVPDATGELFEDPLQNSQNLSRNVSGPLFPSLATEDPIPDLGLTTDDVFLPSAEPVALFTDGLSNLTSDENPIFGTSSFDAGDMPNPTRGNIPYELVSEFTSQPVEALSRPEPHQPPFQPEPALASVIHPPATSGALPFAQPKQRTTQPLFPRKDSVSMPAKPPINPVRLALLILAIAMAVFCIIAGGRMLLGYVQNTEDWSRSHEEFLNLHGASMNQVGEMVVLPQDGSTFAPTSAPLQPVATPLPADGQHVAEGSQQLAPQKQVLRTKLYQYPDNPLRNQVDALTEIRKEYPEVIGRLVIPNVLDEWIVQRNNTYYLNHNYRGTSAEGGAVFMDAACTLDTPPENLHLRGSGSVPGKTFHVLWRYKNDGMAFIYNAEVAHVTTLYEETRYLLFAVIETSGDPANPNYFNYASHPTFATDEEMMNYLALARQHSLYNLPTDIQPGDRLLTLSTVTGADEASDQSTNLVLIFRSVR